MANVYESVKIYSNKPLKSKFRYKDSFQIFPSKIKLKEYNLIILQLVLPKPERYYRYSSNNSDILSRMIIEKVQLLSLFTQFYFFGFDKRKDPIKKFSSNSFLKIKRGQIEWYQDKTLDDRNVPEIIVPEDIESYFEIYDGLDEKRRNIFRKSLYLFYSGIELKATHPSQSFISIISAIETLISFENYSPERCTTCKQYIYEISKRFKDFIWKYAYNDNHTESNKNFISEFYKKRSVIAHTGGLLVADLFWDIEKNTVDWEESFLHKDLIGVARVCLINWLILSNTNF